MVVMLSIIPRIIRGQFAITVRQISEVLGWCFRARKSSVSVSERRNSRRNGISMEPISNGTRHPQPTICSGRRVLERIKPRNAANTTATCWLPDCQATKNPLRPGVAISAR